MTAREFGRAEAPAGQRIRPVGIDHHVGIGQQTMQPVATAGRIQVDLGIHLAMAGIEQQRGDEGQMRRTDAHHRGAMLGQGPSGDRPGYHPAEVEHADTGQRPVTGTPMIDRPARRISDAHNFHQRHHRHRPTLRVGLPLLAAA